MRKPLLILVLAACATAFAVTAAHALPFQESKDVDFKVGNTITAFKASDWIAGEPVKDLDKTKVYVVDFWSAAAHGCKRSIPMMHQLNEELGPKGLQVVAFTQDKEDAAKDYIRERSATMNYSIAVIKEGGGGQSDLWRKAAKFGLLPLAGIVNRQGQICYFGSPFDAEFTRILHLALADRYNTEFIEQAAPILSAARRAARTP